jgi:hypothetical protein
LEVLSSRPCLTKWKTLHSGQISEFASPDPYKSSFGPSQTPDV